MTKPAVVPSASEDRLHPELERLAAHAAGQLRPLERVMVEAHLAFCSSCTVRLRELLEPGARWLEELGRAPVAASVWERLERRLDGAAAIPAAVELPGAGIAGASLPGAVWEELGLARTAVRWLPVLGSRARFTVLAVDEAADLQLVMVGLDGGRRFPTHLHLGNEEVVMLAGGYTDAFAHLDAGDYYHYAPGTEHGTLTDPDEPCWTLGLIEHGVRFRGVLGVLQWLFDPKIRAAGRSAASAARIR